MSAATITQTIMSQPSNFNQGVKANFIHAQRLVMMDGLMGTSTGRDAAFFLATCLTIDSMIHADYMADIDDVLARFGQQTYMNRAIEGLMTAAIAKTRADMTEILDDATDESGTLFSTQMWRDVGAASHGTFHLGETFPQTDREVELWSFSTAVGTLSEFRSHKKSGSSRTRKAIPV